MVHLWVPEIARGAGFGLTDTSGGQERDANENGEKMLKDLIATEAVTPEKCAGCGVPIRDR